MMPVTPSSPPTGKITLTFLAAFGRSWVPLIDGVKVPVPVLVTAEHVPSADEIASPAEPATEFPVRTQIAATAVFSIEFAPSSTSGPCPKLVGRYCFRANAAGRLRGPIVLAPITT